MQTLAHNSEQNQEHVSLPVGSTSLESSEAIKPEALGSSIAGEDIIPYDIRPLTPEVTYPYPLYKSDDYYNKRLAMKPNQVCITFFRIIAIKTLYDLMFRAKCYPYSFYRKVGTVYLHGVRIVSLGMEGKERLCLAQISNTLLKEYSYNEIHNRRVALGITCVQCTPVQVKDFI